MIVSTDQLHKAIMVYAEEEIARKASGVTKFASYFLIARLLNHPEKTVGALLDNPIIKLADIVNADGNIDADELYSAARMAMEKSVSVTISGITFTVPDIDKIYNILQRG
jgi:hypothetical protein